MFTRQAVRDSFGVGKIGAGARKTKITSVDVLGHESLSWYFSG
jgi:hypothetical protein